MLKKAVVSICMAAVMLFSVCGCTPDSNTSLPQLVIGCDDYEPYNYRDADGEPAGLDVDLAKEACARMGYEPVFKKIDWNEKDVILKNGEVDCLWSCLSMDGQEERYEWVGPYMRSRQVMAVLESSGMHKLDELEGKRVAVRVGSRTESLLLKRSDKNIPQVSKVYAQNKNDEIATALRNEYVDAVAGYAATVRRVLENEEVQFRFLDEDLSHARLGVAFSEDSDAKVREELSKALNEMFIDGTTEKILKHYGVETDKALGGLTDE